MLSLQIYFSLYANNIAKINRSNKKRYINLLTLRRKHFARESDQNFCKAKILRLVGTSKNSAVNTYKSKTNGTRLGGVSKQEFSPPK